VALFGVPAVLDKHAAFAWDQLVITMLVAGWPIGVAICWVIDNWHTFRLRW
jgi:hypothetical protein